MHTRFWPKLLNGKPRPRWGDNIRMDLREMWWEAVEWMHLAQDGDQWRDSCEQDNKFSVNFLIS
jgi:hypothetical protein